MLIELSIDFDYTEDEGKALLFLADLILISWFQLISNRKKSLFCTINIPE
jgi:hypothetical protein